MVPFIKPDGDNDGRRSHARLPYKMLSADVAAAACCALIFFSLERVRKPAARATATPKPPTSAYERHGVLSASVNQAQVSPPPTPAANGDFLPSVYIVGSLVD